MRDIMTVAKKELRAFFTDKVLLIQIFILPFLIVFGYCSLFSVLAEPINTENKDEKTNGYYVNSPEYFLVAFETLGMEEAPKTDEETLEKYKTQVKNKELDILVVFPEDFKISGISRSSTIRQTQNPIWLLRSLMTFSKLFSQRYLRSIMLSRLKTITWRTLIPRLERCSEE